MGRAHNACLFLLVVLMDGLELGEKLFAIFSGRKANCLAFYAYLKNLTKCLNNVILTILNFGFNY